MRSTFRICCLRYAVINDGGEMRSICARTSNERKSHPLAHELVHLKRARLPGGFPWRVFLEGRAVRYNTRSEIEPHTY